MWLAELEADVCEKEEEKERKRCGFFFICCCVLSSLSALICVLVLVVFSSNTSHPLCKLDVTDTSIWGLTYDVQLEHAEFMPVTVGLTTEPISTVDEFHSNRFCQFDFTDGQSQSMEIDCSLIPTQVFATCVVGDRVLDSVEVIIPSGTKKQAKVVVEKDIVEISQEIEMMGEPVKIITSYNISDNGTVWLDVSGLNMTNMTYAVMPGNGVPTFAPTNMPTHTVAPTAQPTFGPTFPPSLNPSSNPSTSLPTYDPSNSPTNPPSNDPSSALTSSLPTEGPTRIPSAAPSTSKPNGGSDYN